MKVLLLNGSPHAKGCTYTALAEAAGALEAAGVETEFVHIGTKAIRGCIGCGKCREAKRCVFDDDPVNEAIEKARACDGFIFGSPVYYASPNGAALAFLDRLFYAGGSALRYKPGAAVVSARRGGTTAALDALKQTRSFPWALPRCAFYSLFCMDGTGGHWRCAAVWRKASVRRRQSRNGPAP